MPRQKLRRSDRLLKILDAYGETIVIMHNNPDPDAIATGWALLRLVDRKLHKPARLLGRGPVLRAENVQLLRLLQPPIELVEEISPDSRSATVLVDCAPGSANHLLGGQKAPVAVIDHHESKSDGFRIPFRDMRSTVTASASIATQYLREQRLTPPTPVAIALLYAIRTEMIGSSKALSRVDHAALQWLSEYAEYDVLSKIENPPLPRYYYEELLLGLDSVRVYADSAVCFLPRITAPETVGEVADLLIRCVHLKYVLCGGRVGDDFLFSVRSKGDKHTALTLLDPVLRGLGNFGGHLHRAGGRISVPMSGMDSDRLEQEVRRRWLDACGSKVRRGQRLVARKEIMR